MKIWNILLQKLLSFFSSSSFESASTGYFNNEGWYAWWSNKSQFHQVVCCGVVFDECTHVFPIIRLKYHMYACNCCDVWASQGYARNFNCCYLKQLIWINKKSRSIENDEFFVVFFVFVLLCVRNRKTIWSSIHCLNYTFFLPLLIFYKVFVLFKLQLIRRIEINSTVAVVDCCRVLGRTKKLSKWRKFLTRWFGSRTNAQFNFHFKPERERERELKIQNQTS